MKHNFEPKIVAFVCTWCTYAGADLAGTSRMQYPANVRVIKFPCTGRIDVATLLHSFEKGAVLTAYFKTMDELIERRSRGHHAAEKALLELLETGRSAVPATRTRRRETKLSRRMRKSPRARALARAFTVH